MGSPDDRPVAERRQATRRKADRVLPELFDHVSDGVVVLDRDWVYRYVNAAAGRLLERDPSALVGRHYHAEFPEARDQPFYRAYERAMASGEPAVLEEHYAPWDRWFENRLYPGPYGLAILFSEVTARKRAEHALREREARQALILATLAVGTWSWDLLEDTVSASSGLAALIGRRIDPPEATLTLAGREWFAQVHPDDVAEVRRRFERLAREGAPYQATFRFLHRDGHFLWVHATGDAVRDASGAIVGAAGGVRDMSGEHAALEAVRESEERFRTLAENAPVGIFRRTPAMELAYANRRLLEITGRSLEAMLGRGWLEALHPEDRDAVTRAIAEAEAEGRPRDFTYRIRRPDGVVRSVLARAAPVRGPDGAVTTYVGTVDDVTERREAEERLRQAQKLEALGRLAGGVAHDFNNLLTVIRTHLEFALEDLPVGSASADDLRTVTQATERAAQLVRQLLAVGRRRTIATQRVDLNATVGDSERLLRRMLPAHVTMTVERSPTPAPVDADPAQLEQVLLNLVVNARDAIDARADGGAGGMLALRVFQCEVRADPNGERAVVCASGDPPDAATLEPGAYVALEVRDTGVGMDAGTRQRALEPFFTTKAVGRGTGLGLATVHGIAAQMGGTVAIASEPLVGTTVVVYLARAAEPDAPTDGARVAADQSAAPPLTRGVAVDDHADGAPGTASVGHGRAPRREPPTVLVVEDEAAVRTATSRILGRHGYRVLEARHGADALLVWRAERHAGRTVAGVITDLMMPEMGGAELIARLRVEAPGLPVLAVSGYAPEGSDALGAADVAFLAKPFTVDALLGAVAELLGDARAT